MPVLAGQWMAFASRQCLAEPASRTPTVFFKVSEGYSIYKSEMLQSNDTSTTLSYSFGVFGGRDNSFGMALERESSQFSLQLNNTSMGIDAEMLQITYNFGPVWFGVLVTNGSWTATSPPDADQNNYLDLGATADEYLTIVYNGYGAHSGFRVGIFRRTELYGQFAYSTTTKVLQKTPENPVAVGLPNTEPSLSRKVSLGPRLDVDLGSSIGLTRDWLSLLFGFKYRTYQITVEDKTFAELHNTTYLGFNATWYF